MYFTEWLQLTRLANDKLRADNERLQATINMLVAKLNAPTRHAS